MLDSVIRFEPLKLDAAVSLAAELMHRHEAPAVPVVGPKEGYEGIVSIFSLLRRRVPASTKLRSLVERAPALSDLSDPISIARLFVRTGSPGLALLQGFGPVGVVSARRLILTMGLTPRVPSHMLIHPIQPLSPDDPVEKARKLAAQVGLRLIPVASEGRLRGVVRVYDLVRFIYVTPVQRRSVGEVAGEVNYYLRQPVRGLTVEAERVVDVDSVPTTRDIADGCAVVSKRGEVVGVISPYLLLRKLLPVVEEAAVPLRVEGASDLDFISQRLIYTKSLEVAKGVAERARLLEASLVLKPRRKGVATRYEATASIKLDVGVYSASAEAWNSVQAAVEALDAAYKRFSRAKERVRERKLSAERLRRLLS